MAGDREAADLIPLVYAELQDLAARYLRQERRAVSIEPISLVHEAYLRLASRKGVRFRGRTHFLALAAIQMRHILVERARAAASQKRGGNLRRITLSDEMGLSPDGVVELLALDEAMSRLSQRNERRGRISEMRLFAGMTSGEIASHLGISERTAREDWRVARAWLMKELYPERRSS